MIMNQAVQEAVEEIKATLSPCTCEIQDDPDGGAWVIVEDVPIGEIYEPERSWVGFRITFQYPNADVYPHFIRGDVRRKDGRPLGDGIQSNHTFLGRPALQLSRRSNRLNPLTDTAALKLMKVLKWLSAHP